MTERNYGLQFEEQKPEDYVFGASLPFEELTNGDWSKYLPKKELQNLNTVEPYACVAFTILNCVEILIKRKYNEERNYSDRFLAAISGTKESGNTPQKVCEFLRKLGVVSQKKWPFNETINTFDKFYAPIPPKLYDLAKEFKEEWSFKHEYVPLDDESISKALKCSPLLISVAAWFKKDNLYYRPNGVTDNHATTLFKETKDTRVVFDSYDSYIKDYRKSDTPMVIKRFWIEKRTIKDNKCLLCDIIDKIRLWN